MFHTLSCLDKETIECQYFMGFQVELGTRNYSSHYVKTIEKWASLVWDSHVNVMRSGLCNR